MSDSDSDETDVDILPYTILNFLKIDNNIQYKQELEKQFLGWFDYTLFELKNEEIEKMLTKPLSEKLINYLESIK